MDKIAYLEETRAEKIARYLGKKERRIWERKVFYDCRKIVADNRERLNGRFVKKSPFVGFVGESAQKSSLATIELEAQKEMEQIEQFYLA